MGKEIDLDKLLGDSGDDPDFPNVVPPHIGLEGVDTRAINAFAHFSGNAEVKTRLYQRMSPETETALVETLEWLVKQERNEYYALLRADIWRQREAIEAAKRKIFPNGPLAALNEVYVTYLIKQGLSAQQANSGWRHALLILDANLARISGRGTIYDVEPKGFGPYALLGYPLRLGTRWLMLRGADPQRYYNWTAGPAGS